MTSYDFLHDTFETERLKTLSVWSLFRDGDLSFRPAPLSRTPHEQMVHRCVGEDAWMMKMLGIDAGLPALPADESRLAFLRRYAEVSERRLTHSAHHRAQLTVSLRLLRRSLHSTYGPTADTGGLFQSHAPVLYRTSTAEELLAAEAEGGRLPPLPGPGAVSPTERPARA